MSSANLALISPLLDFFGYIAYNTSILNSSKEADHGISEKKTQRLAYLCPSVLSHGVPGLRGPSGPGSGPEPPKYAPSGNLIQYDPLWQQNNDMAGWLYIEDTQIDLPVMYTPSNLEKYLRRAFDGSYALSGSLFLGADWSPEADHAIIYGHNMKDGAMFGGLSKYKDADYAQAHSVVHFDTLTEEREYVVLAAFYSRIYEQQAEGVFRYYQYTDLSDQDRFEEYIRQVRAAALYDTGVEVQYGDRLLTLSTCSYHRDNGRFVVVACQKQEPQTGQPDGSD